MTANPAPDPNEQPHDAVPERFRVDLGGRTLLGVYEVESKLADGGMGSIYLARDTSLDRKVVVKVPHARFLAETGFRARLAREISELVRLEHPQVVRIVARGEVDDIPFFVLQYLGGGSLEDRLAKSGRQTPEEALPWLAAMAQTLDFVHKRGSLHRDVKPGNILFDAEGHVFLSDFGVAKAVDAKGDALTGTGVGIGSPKYMAPEQALGHAVGPAVDQYGLASSLYEALAGDLPFSGTPVEILVRKSREDAPPIRERVPDLPEAAAAALMRAMARDPAERFPSCQAFADAFTAAVAPAADVTQPLRVPASTPTALQLPGDRQGRRRVRLVGGLLAAALLVVALATILAPGDGEPDPAPPALTPRSSLAEVQLIDAGAAPHRLLRYGVTAGARERLALRMDPAEMVEIPGLQRIETIGPAWTLESSLLVEQIDEEGDLHFVWTITRCALCEPGVDQTALSEALLGLDGFTVRGQIDTRGIVHAVAFEESKQRVSTMRRLLESLRMVLDEFATPLPSEPVGVGARWAVARAMDQMGMRTVETSEYEVVSIDGDALTLRVKTALTAPEQIVSFPDAPPELNLTLTSFHGRGTSDIRIELDHLAPRALASLISGHFEMEAEIPETAGAWTGAFRHEVEMRRSPAAEGD